MLENGCVESAVDEVVQNFEASRSLPGEAQPAIASATASKAAAVRVLIG